MREVRLSWCRTLAAGALSLSALEAAMAAESSIAPANAPAAALVNVDFARDIRPIFESRCYECHGEKKQKNGLRLDRKNSAFQPSDSGKPAIVSGKSADSPLIQRLASHDPDEVMPPKGERLTATQIDLLRAWIDQGATWPEAAPPKKHWAYLKPTRPEMPDVKNTRWPQNAIDFFVLERLEKERLRPVPEATRATLIRRVSLDLIGRPPTLAEVDEFLGDSSRDAYEKLVDRLLASPQYGERWARPWLDLARYADTQGYEKDNRRTIWPYRDWVINALNRNLPFDQFTIEQIAGDLLPDATPDQKIATGFHRNTLTNTEGGTDDEEFRHEAIVDRVDTTMSVWMGTTFGCSRCHNHKYDPFTMKDYYQFYAFLNNTADSDKDDERPTMKVFKPGQEEQWTKLRDAVKTSEKKFNEAAEQPLIVEGQKQWEQQTIFALTNWHALDPKEVASAGGAMLTANEDRSVLVSGKNPSNDIYTVSVETDAKRITGFRLEVLESGEDKALGRHPNGSFVLTKFEVKASSAGSAQAAEAVMLKRASADYSQEGFSVTNLIAGTSNGWAVGAADRKLRLRRAAYFTPEEPLEFTPGARLTFVLRHGSAKSPQANIARFRLSVTSAEPFTPPPQLPDDVRPILLASADKQDEKQRTRLTEHYHSIAPELKEVRETLAAARKAEKSFYDPIPITSVMEELPKSRETHMLIRGGFLSKGEKVSPGTPAVLPSLKFDSSKRVHDLAGASESSGGNAQASSNRNGSEGSGEASNSATESRSLPNRLDLAQWLVNSDNPLTARVIMNRIWAQYFGIGIVETVEDFGIQGEPPSHPKLLDWLATELMRVGWDMKAMHKLIVMSATYRQSSRPTSELLQRDPYNRLLARGPRVRLEAEMVRDQALAVSGLLSQKLGGPSVMPPQPEGLWQIVYSGDKWETSKGDDKYRRGLYTFWRRSMPHPAMTTFDAPTREYCVLKRTRSNTPLQALVLMNDPAYIECAQALARRMMAETGATPDEKVAYAFRLCLARPAKRGEVQRLVALYQEQLQRFKRDEQAAEKMAGSEASKASTGCNPAELAAWTVVANVLLNLDEMVTKG